MGAKVKASEGAGVGKPVDTTPVGSSVVLVELGPSVFVSSVGMNVGV